MNNHTIKSHDTAKGNEPDNRDNMKGRQVSPLRAYKRSPALSNSTWYKGILCSQMAGTADNNGAFDTIISRMRRGTEPPPHVHSREDEFFYILSGEVRVYADGEVFQVTAGECVYLPCRKPHAFVITSDEAHIIITITPGAFFEAISKMNAPAERMEIPPDADTITYATADLTETMTVFEQYGIRLLTPDEIHAEMPQYPLPVDVQGYRETALTSRSR
jgi:mannose-6-phosphate isomerase-like protein (cupin superfamily)